MMELEEKTPLEMANHLKELSEKIEGDDDLHPSQYTDEDIKLIYTIAHKYYTIEQYQQAEVMFMRLVLARGDNIKFWKGLASSRQMQNDHAGALVAWGMCAMLDENDLLNHIYGAECLVSLEEFDQARQALDHVEKSITEDHVAYQKFYKLKLAAQG
ncbi:MAG: hypothetical protein S4CHLAM20_08560 [Chlamydiia bacterium]|nr:hypothetical protein [Chlamydiia bacterium]